MAKAKQVGTKRKIKPTAKMKSFLKSGRANNFFGSIIKKIEKQGGSPNEIKSSKKYKKVIDAIEKNFGSGKK